MRLVTYEINHRTHCGVLVADRVLPVEHLARAAGLPATPAGIGTTVKHFLELGPAYWSALARAAEEADPAGGHALDAVRLLPPVPDPDKILCIGLNYHDHAEETGMAAPSAPIVFAKYRNSLAGAGDPIVVPDVTDAVDYEAELAVVIGRRCRGVTAENALDFVAGVTAFNDVSARDLQMATSQWTIGKAIDTFAPCGPALVFLDEIPDIQALKVGARVNGTTVQAGTTASMIFGVAEIIAYLSQVMTLEPGDIIATGTPAGVGYTRTPQILLKPGDVVEVEIEGVGLLANPLVSATSDGRP
ncbi:MULTISPECIES: fumarylacetoacetate hydrolase family protein [Streptomyces]|uniref:fumarylacetoacetate hydrolase family protein n=1 Tax=Streptomyces lycopersici TaxID=2974589 RepID=UPI0021D1DFBF|nr:fumarylacetoacetate hydrolase family protein [Streptomyces sp. NEAU-383]